MNAISTRTSRRILFFAVLGGALLAGVTAAIGAQDSAKKLDPEKTCLGCHDKIIEVIAQSVPHEPAQKGECASCHAPHASRYDHLLNVRERALCFSCHEDQKLAFQLGSVHTPIKQGKCIVCHEVHGSENKALLKLTGTELCLSCHEKKKEQLSYPKVHDAFGDGDCADCHLSHNSEHKFQLTLSPTDLCLDCHDVDDEDVLDAHSGIPVAGSQCTGCHEPHASTFSMLVRPVVHQPFGEKQCGECHLLDSDTPRLLQATGGRLCFKCHEPFQSPKFAVIHDPVANGNCRACHVPHAGDEPKLLAANTRQVCLQCHADLEERGRNSRSVHPVKVEKGSCTACHQPHFSDSKSLLFAGPIRTCLSCHETQQHGHPLGSDRLDPRTGEEITCVTCHDPHGTAYPYTLRGDQSRGLCVECHNDDHNPIDK